MPSSMKPGFSKATPNDIPPMCSKTYLAAGLFVLICLTAAAEEAGPGPATPPLSAPWQKKL